MITFCRKVFSNALSTRVSVGNQSVYMVAGLAKKKTQQIVRDITTTLEPISSTLVLGGVVTQQTIKQCRGAVSTPATPTVGVASLSSVRPDYSTQSPLAISSKAVTDAKRAQANCNDVGVAMNGGDGVELEGVSKAKRIKLMTEEVDGGVNCMVAGDGAGSILDAKVEKLINKNHQLLSRCSPIERTPSPSFVNSPCPSSPSPSLDSSPFSSRTASPLPVEMPSGQTNGANLPTDSFSKSSSPSSNHPNSPSNTSNHFSNHANPSSNYTNTSSNPPSNLATHNSSSEAAELMATNFLDGRTCQWGTCNRYAEIFWRGWHEC